MITGGIDPGAKYTAVVIRDGDDVLHSSTYVKPVDVSLIAWASRLADKIKAEIIPLYRIEALGIEGISDPRGYSNGKLSLLNPKSIIHTGIVLGAVSNSMLSLGIPVVVVPPKRNGANVESFYPDVLNGRRPKDLPGMADGAGTRRHEKSAYDIAGEVELLVSEGYHLDDRLPL